MLARRRWAWTLAVVVNTVTLLLTLVRPVAAGHLTPDVLPFLALAGLALLMLVSRRGRAALRGVSREMLPGATRLAGRAAGRPHPLRLGGDGAVSDRVTGRRAAASRSSCGEVQPASWRYSGSDAAPWPPGGGTYMTPEEMTDEVNRRQTNALTASGTPAPACVRPGRRRVAARQTPARQHRRPRHRPAHRHRHHDLLRRHAERGGGPRGRSAPVHAAGPARPRPASSADNIPYVN